jgi:hypothetical protein
VFPLLLAVLKKGRQYTELVYARRPSELVSVLGSRPPKLVYVSPRNQKSTVFAVIEATCANVKMFSVIVICCSYNRLSE